MIHETNFNDDFSYNKYQSNSIKVQATMLKVFEAPQTFLFHNLFFCTIYLHFDKDGYHSSIEWLSTIQIYVSTTVDITTIFDS